MIQIICGILSIFIINCQMCLAYNEDVSAAISEAKLKISEAQNFINSASSEVSSINAEKSIILSESSQLRSEESQAIASKNRLNEQNNQVVDKIKNELSPELYSLEQDILEEEYNITNLGELLISFNDLDEKVSYNQNSFTDIKNNYGEVNRLYQTWLLDFNSFVEDKSPDFDSIIDRQSYNTIVASISNAFQELPNTAHLLAKESTIQQALNSYLVSTDRLIEYIRVFPGTVNLATLRKFNNNEIDLESLKYLDLALRHTYKQATRFSKAIEQMRRQRELIIFNLVRIWQAYATLKLHIVNIEFGVEIILEVDRVLKSPDIYAQIKSKTEFYAYQMQDLAGSIYPFSAHKSTIDAYKFHSLLIKQMENLDLSDSFKIEVKNLMTDFLIQRDIYFELAEGMLMEAEIYLSEWQNIVVRRLRRLGDSVTSQCLSLATRIQDTSEPTAEIESEFLEFREGC